LYQEPWKELDEESLSRKANTPSESTNPPSLERYYGRVHFTTRIISTSLGNLQLALDSPELGNSTRFARQFGSESIIRINISPKQIANYTASRLKLFLKSTFVLFGRAFQAYCLKDGHVFLINIAYPSSRHRHSLFHVLNWHNPVLLNQDQAAAKWAARFQLGHSTTVPAIYVASHRVHNNLGDFGEWVFAVIVLMLIQVRRPNSYPRPRQTRGQSVHDRWLWLC
jgi:RNA-dependent RNA polymerase